jgi:hypothetical protein
MTRARQALSAAIATPVVHHGISCLQGWTFKFAPDPVASKHTGTFSDRDSLHGHLQGQISPLIMSGKVDGFLMMLTTLETLPVFGLSGSSSLPQVLYIYQRRLRLILLDKKLRGYRKTHLDVTV